MNYWTFASLSEGTVFKYVIFRWTLLGGCRKWSLDGWEWALRIYRVALFSLLLHEDVVSQPPVPAACCHVFPSIMNSPSGAIGPNKILS